MKKLHLLIGLSVWLLGNNSCHKELFATIIKGTVRDYFDGHVVQGVNVAVVYTYDFKKADCNNPPCPCVPPDTIVKTTTDNKGGFKLKFHPKRKNEIDQCGVGIPNVFGKKEMYGYLLIFYKEEEDYFKQYLVLGDPEKNQKLDYKIKPLITLEFKVFSSTNPNDSVVCGISAKSDFDNEYYNVGIKGRHIDTTLINKVSFNELITTNVYIGELPSYSLVFSDKIFTVPFRKNFKYEINY